jgi:hypothetical protein
MSIAFRLALLALSAMFNPFSMFVVTAPMHGKLLLASHVFHAAPPVVTNF